MSPGRETSRTQSCLKHLQTGSERPHRLRTRHPIATAPITGVPNSDALQGDGQATPPWPGWAVDQPCNGSWFAAHDDDEPDKDRTTAAQLSISGPCIRTPVRL